MYAISWVNLLNDYEKKAMEHDDFLIRDDLCIASRRLDLQSLMLVKSQSVGTHQMLKVDTTNTIRQMPRALDSLKKCRTFWQLVMCWNLHFVAAGRTALQEYELATSNPSAQESPKASTTKHLCGIVYIALNRIHPELLAERDRYLSDIRRWGLASEQLFSQSPPQLRR
jgi:hypothetical protein